MELNFFQILHTELLKASRYIFYFIISLYYLEFHSRNKKNIHMYIYEVPERLKISLVSKNSLDFSCLESVRDQTRGNRRNRLLSPIHVSLKDQFLRIEILSPARYRAISKSQIDENSIRYSTRR